MSRRETFELTRPDGVVVVVDRDIDTGEQTVTVREAEPEGVEPEGDGRPRGNASTEAWATYAASIGVQFDVDAKRDDIRAAVEAAAVEQ